ncbi:MAG: hypothetical protein ABWK01_03455 [Infirmifilum sp.]
MAGEAKPPSREEALLQELLYAIAHIAHAEQHLVEIDSQLSESKLSSYIDRLRISRKDLGQILLEIAGFKESGNGGEARTPAESLWCTIKHLSMAVVHCDECAEKVIRRLNETLKNGAAAEARPLLSYLHEIYRVRREAFDMLTRLVRGNEISGETVEAVRCREDLCVE